MPSTGKHKGQTLSLTCLWFRFLTKEEKGCKPEPEDPTVWKGLQTLRSLNAIVLILES